MMGRFVVLLLQAFFFHCPFTIAQSAFIVSEDDSESTHVIFDPLWIKQNNIKEIVFDRFYANQPKRKPFNSVSLRFDSTGYQTAEFEAKDADHPDEKNFLRKRNIQYFITGGALIKSVKTFGRKNTTDSVEEFPEAYILAGNPEQLDELIVGPDTIFYKYDDLRRPVVITQSDGVHIRTIQYNKSGQVSRITQNYKTNSRVKPGSYREYDYSREGRLKSVKLYSGSHMFMTVRYEYNEKGFPVKTLIFGGQLLEMTLVYRYVM